MGQECSAETGGGEGESESGLLDRMDRERGSSRTRASPGRPGFALTGTLRLRLGQAREGARPHTSSDRQAHAGIVWCWSSVMYSGGGAVATVSGEYWGGYTPVPSEDAHSWRSQGS